MLRIIGLLIYVQCLCLEGIVGRRVSREIRCDCGVRNEGERHLSVGENVTTEYAGNHAWPWMASIVNVSVTDDPVAYCGASLINTQYIMTAAHCIPDMQTTGLGNFRVYLGTNFITPDLEEEFLEMEITEIKSHPKFDFETAEFDIALIKLSENVRFTKLVRPICLKQPKELDGRKGIITGWGSFNLTAPTEEELKESDMTVVSNDICQKNYSTVEIPVTNTMLCGQLKGQTPCKGDSGGPFVLMDKNRYHQIGIISHGQGCSVPDFPTIFSRVSVFIGWIQENTQDAFYCRNSI